MPHSSLAIANEFLTRSAEARRPITAMHLQKFCYVSHGFTLALLDHALTSDKPEAWDYDPVYPALYDALKMFGTSPVIGPICRNNWASDERARGEPVWADISLAERRLIDTVWKDLGRFEAFQLSALTHKDNSPWAAIYRPGAKHLTIPDHLIKEYFLGLTELAA